MTDVGATALLFILEEEDGGTLIALMLISMVSMVNPSNGAVLAYLPVWR